MNIKEYLQDKRYLIALTIAGAIFLIFFMSVIGLQTEVMIVIMVTFLLIPSITLAVEYQRRRGFYREVMGNLEALDQKYLLTEMLPEAFFIDGEKLTEILHITNKSMADSIQRYRISQEDYLSYLELWIHEVKTPVAAIALIASNHPSDEMTNVLDEVGHIQNYLEQVLFYARSSSVEKDYLIQKINLKPHVQSVIKELSTLFIKKRVALNLEHLDIDVYCDAKWLEYIIKQIVDNALKYVEEGTGIITITGAINQQNISLTIADNGPGIPSQDLRRVFDRGFTGQRGRSHKQATGMGLYLVKTLSDKMGLGVSIASQDGTQVTLVFPKSDMMFK